MRQNAHTLRRLLTVVALTLIGMQAAFAEGTLTHLSGQVSVKNAAGASTPAAVGAKVVVGDTVLTGKGAFARMEMSDGGEMVLRPESQLQVQAYHFIAAKPKEDSFIFSMVKGGIRTVTGLIGKRGNRDAYSLKTETATVGIRGTQFDLRVCAGNCGALADGTYLAVRFGAVQTTNAQGTLAVAAGQVAYVPTGRAPTILPRDPGIGFTPPAVIPKLDERKKQKTAEAEATPGGPSKGGPPSGDKPQGEGKSPQATNQQSTNKQTTNSQATESGGPECSVE